MTSLSERPTTYLLEEQVSTISPEQEMKMLGVSSEYELARYRAVASVAGHHIAQNEIQRNIRAYDREFLQDLPVGEQHRYFHYNDFFYSEQMAHPLFQIGAQIDPRERDGKTLGGFLSFQKEVMGAENDEVVLWYSPAGSAGSEEPFSDIFFDSGRLYVAYKENEGLSNHIDIKVDESRFPLDALRKQLGYIGLEHPLNTRLSKNDFIKALQRFDNNHEINEPVYISQRDSETATAHYFSHVIAELELQMSGKKAPALEAVAQKLSVNDDLTQQDIQNMYMHALRPYVEQNGHVTLYGCSTTSIIESALESGQDAGFPGLSSTYSTFARIMQGGELVSGCGVAGCMIREPHFHCPTRKEGGCGGAIPSGKGHETCPHCGLTKEQHAKNTGASCD